MSVFSDKIAAIKARVSALWAAFKLDFNERFMKFDTIRGIIKVPVGLVLAYMAIYHIQFFFQTVGVCAGIYLTVDGLRNVFVNPIKQDLAHADKIVTRVNANAAGSPAGVASGPVVVATK